MTRQVSDDIDSVWKERALIGTVRTDPNVGPCARFPPREIFRDMMARALVESYLIKRLKALDVPFAKNASSGVPREAQELVRLPTTWFSPHATL
jgi:hypothetical protein